MLKVELEQLQTERAELQQQLDEIQEQFKQQQTAIHNPYYIMDTHVNAFKLSRCIHFACENGIADVLSKGIFSFSFE